MSLRVGSPVAGRVVALSAVPDPVFSQAMVGPGVAVEPAREKADVVSPVDGTVVTLHPHAFVVATGDGAAVLVHLGIDTVKRKGEGFELHVVKGEQVQAGQRIVTWDPAEVEAAGFAPICPVIALDASAEVLGDFAVDVDVTANDTLFDWSR
ncbi:PTS system N-acetylglucosamine-specific IIA component, Glc family [Lentzea xinjiangensis]|uniref:PTS system N-acetylglucosamine-specific IIA component, Glc family n=1 Tax=Lentzea xinjiangensis TaxID=402600 RepID=A0A1H9SHA6_9PSEU|nr:PTS glucose transporter subunit IIA [Lentzea xinjiangensis]SER84341.1 PTS system N-acetylglucosamine-specific IIA component, Glc family [Lentzea xinjiangensis]